MNRPNNNKSLGSRGASFATTIALLGGSAIAVIAFSPVGAFAQSKKHSNAPADVYIREVGPDYNHPYSPTAVTPDVPAQYAYDDNGSTTTGSGVSSRAQYPASSRIASHNVDGIMSRIAAMFTTARSHANASGVPSTARESYKTAAASLQRALTAGHVRTNGASIGSYANMPISSFQLADDIRTLRAEAQAVKPAQAAALNQIAILYAAGAKEFFTATLRDALLRPVNSSRYAANGTGSVSSALMPAGRSTTYHVRGSRQTGGILQPDGTVASVSVPINSTAGLVPAGLPAANDSLPFVDPFPFNTAGIDDVEVFPVGIPAMGVAPVAGSSLGNGAAPVAPTDNAPGPVAIPTDSTPAPPVDLLP